MLTVGSLFTGVGGFDRGLERAGMLVLWQVERDKQCRAVLRQHWPDVPCYEDVRDVGGSTDVSGGPFRGDEPDSIHPAGGGREQRRGTGADSVAGPLGGSPARRTTLAPVDLICGGFPCQDLSVAGRRAGLEGARSGLWHEFHRIVGQLLPRWVLVENVPGLLSSVRGRDFAVILRGLAELGYVGAWRSLDSQYLGVAQRRERLFVLAVRGAGTACPAEVLAFAEGLSGHPAPRRATGQDVAGTLGGRASGEGGPRNDLDNHGAYPLMPTLSPGIVFGGNATIGVAQSLAIRGRDGVPQVELGTDGLANAILTPNGGRAGVGAGAVLTAVPRRLTPRECERLQAFPDDWTRWKADGLELADGPRYRMMGNAVTVAVAEWIGRRIVVHMDGAAG